jgi:hypothetical protein
MVSPEKLKDRKNKKMKNYFLLVIQLCSALSCVGADNSRNSDVTYYRFSEDHPFYLISLEASINNSIPGNFALASGLEDKIIVDSAFFYHHVDTSNLTRITPPLSEDYWQAFYEGEVAVVIGEHRFQTRKIEVRNQWSRYKYQAQDYCLTGIIGAGVFRDKITIVDWDSKHIAFADTFSVDTSYSAVPLLPPKTLTETNSDQRFIEIDGLTDKKGDKKKGYFLFDTGASSFDLVLKSSYAQHILFDVQHPTPADSRYNRGAKDWVWLALSLNIGTIRLNKSIDIRSLKDDIEDNLEQLLTGGDGIIGMGIMKKYNFILDYKRNILYLKRNNWPIPVNKIKNSQ